MRALIQRVKSGSVTINKQDKRSIGPGLVILIGITHTDQEKDADLLAQKCVNLRIFEDDNGKMNKSLQETYKRCLVVSQFTLYADARKGLRPSFSEAAIPHHAIPLYNRFISTLEQLGIEVKTGEFGADMLVDIQNDGPVTIMLQIPPEK